LATNENKHLTTSFQVERMRSPWQLKCCPAR